jgi:hypothetical protein
VGRGCKVYLSIAAPFLTRGASPEDACSLERSRACNTSYGYIRDLPCLGMAAYSAGGATSLLSPSVPVLTRECLWTAACGL